MEQVFAFAALVVQWAVRQAQPTIPSIHGLWAFRLTSSQAFMSAWIRQSKWALRQEVQQLRQSLPISWKPR